MDQPEARPCDFAKAYAANWSAIMSGGPSIPVAFFAYYIPNDIVRVLAWVLAACSLVFSAFIVWRTERLKVIALSGRNTEIHRTTLAKLRAKGVAMRNIAEDAYDEPNRWALWETAAIAWNLEVAAAIAKFSEADSVWFSILDVVPPPRIDIHPNCYDDDKDRLYAMHDYRLARLNTLIERWGG